MKSLLTFTLLFLISTQSLAESSREQKRFGAWWGVNDPAPGAVGVNFGYNLNSFSRVHLGAGIQSNAGEAFADEVGTNMMAALGYILTLGQVDWDELKEFFSDEDKEQTQTATSWGGGVSFFWPDWNLSPTVGINLAQFEATNGALNLKRRGTHVYYKAGVDWQMEKGFLLGAGWLHAPSLPNPIADRFYFNIGWFF